MDLAEDSTASRDLGHFEDVRPALAEFRRSEANLQDIDMIAMYRVAKREHLDKIQESWKTQNEGLERLRRLLFTIENKAVRESFGSSEWTYLDDPDCLNSDILPMSRDMRLNVG